MKRVNCGCKPGTYENGWQEQRSAECLKKEREAFGHVIAWILQNKKEIMNGRFR